MKATTATSTTKGNNILIKILFVKYLNETENKCLKKKTDNNNKKIPTANGQCYLLNKT